MAYTVVRFEPTPNPNALKVWLDAPISDVPRSFLRREMAAGEPLAEALFDDAGATTLLFCGEWFTFNKRPGDAWPAVKGKIRQVVSREHPANDERPAGP